MFHSSCPDWAHVITLLHLVCKKLSYKIPKYRNWTVFAWYLLLLAHLLWGICTLIFTQCTRSMRRCSCLRGWPVSHHTSCCPSLGSLAGKCQASQVLELECVTCSYWELCTEVANNQAEVFEHFSVLKEKMLDWTGKSTNICYTNQKTPAAGRTLQETKHTNTSPDLQISSLPIISW